MRLWFWIKQKKEFFCLVINFLVVGPIKEKLFLFVYSLIELGKYKLYKKQHFSRKEQLKKNESLKKQFRLENYQFIHIL